jgi:hypothetical protein
MIQLCAWCRSEIRKVADGSSADSCVSHGICPSCYDNIRFQEGVPLGEYLDSRKAPVFVVDGSGVVQGVNRMGCETLGKDTREIVQHLGGDVFECAYARLPEGCGRTVHCSGCTIRRTVMRTFETGQSQSKVPAVLNHGDADEPTSVHLTITTVKVNNIVLLRVDEMATA